MPTRRLATAALLYLFVVAGLAAAQDSVKLTSGERIFGEVRNETEDAVEFIDKDGRLLRFPRAEVEKVTVGRPISRSLQKRLDAIDQGDPQALLVLAEAALAEKGARNDALRIVRRALALDPESVRAHELLDHVFELGRWFPSREAADSAIAALMESQGLVRVGEGFAEPDDAEAVSAAPKEWMIVEHRWRLVSVVMKERGYIEWSGVWYPPEEKDVIRQAKQVEGAIGKTLAGALKGETTALDVRGREKALHMADLIEKARAWFGQRFDLPFVARNPDILNVVLEDKKQYEAFLFDCQPIHRIEEERIEFYRKDPNRTPQYWFNVASQVHILADSNDEGIDHSVVHGVGHRLMDHVFVGESWNAPDWLARAAGHHAEIAVLGSANLGAGAVVDKYGRGGQNVDGGFKNLEATKKRLAKRLKKRDQGARWLFGLERSDLSEESDDLAIVFLAWLFETRSEGLCAFVREPDKTLEMHTRFQRHFGLDFEAADGEFRAWLGL